MAQPTTLQKASPLAVTPERITSRKNTEGGRIFLGDNLTILRQWPDECTDLVYIDPPFNTGKKRRLQSIKLHRGERSRAGFGGKNYHYAIHSDFSYADDMQLEDYLSFMEERLTEGRRILKSTGSFFLHIDPRVVHHARLIMDRIFGPERFVNEIIWAYDYGGRPRDRWPSKHDNILWYSKSKKWIFNRDAIDRIPYMAPGLVGPEKAARGKLPTDTWWMTIVPTNSKEKTGYPTQKPEKLLTRIISGCTNPGDLIVDFFAGSGTTGAVAEKLGRRWIMIDKNPDAVKIMHARIADIRQGRQPLFAVDNLSSFYDKQ